MNFFSKKLWGALLLSAGLITTTHADELFSNVYSFGDSLSDTGNKAGSPITSPGGDVWAKYFAANFGIGLTPSNSGGTDYAIAGDQTGSGIPGISSPADGGALQQARNFLTANPRVDSKAIYTLWAGSNDINQDLTAIIGKAIVVEGKTLAQAIAEAQASAPTIINSGVNNLMSILTLLHNAGARYFLLFNLPNLGQTPAGSAIPSLSPGLTNIASAFNTVLAAKASNLGFQVIQIDIFGLLNEVMANPAKFGFNPTTIKTPYKVACPSQTCDASTFLFYDTEHPTATGHLAVAQYAYSIVIAPTAIAYLAETPFNILSAQNSSDEQQLFNIRTGLNKLAPGQFAAFADANYSPINQDSSGTELPGFRSHDINLIAGVVNRLNGYTITGVSVGHTHSNINFGHHLGDYSIDENMASLFADITYRHAYIDGILSGGFINFDHINRNITIAAAQEVASGNTKGNHLGAELFGGYNLIDSTLKTGPVADLSYQHVSVDGYAEDGAGVANMQFGDQKNESLIGALGWQASYLAELNNIQIMPFGKITFNHQWINKDRNIEAGLVSIPTSQWTLPVNTTPERNYGLLNVGVGISPVKNINFSLGYSTTLLQSDARAQNVGLSIQFNI